MGREFELKYRATPEQQQAIQKELGGVFSAIAMETTYFDTPDRRLAAQKVTLRCRLENGTAVCTVKTPGDTRGRGEWETPCCDIMDAIPMLCKLGCPAWLEEATKAGVEPVCGARFTRQAAQIVLPDVTAELALDRGILMGGGREEDLCEVEVELKSGSEETLEKWAGEFAARFGLVPERKSKFRRALALAEGEKNGSI